MCEHPRQVWDPGYAVCVDCGAETTAAPPPGEPEPVVLVPLTASDKARLRQAVERTADGFTFDAQETRLLKLLEG